MDILKTLEENLPSMKGFYHIYRTTACDGCFEDIVSKFDIDNAIEIGTNNGLSTLVLAKYVKGAVFTFDIAKSNADYIWSFFPELRKKIYSVVGTQSYIDEIIRNIKDETDLNFNFAFIDGEHTYEACKHDYEICKTAGVNKFLFHDINNWEVCKFALIELKGERLNYLYGLVGG